MQQLQQEQLQCACFASPTESELLSLVYFNGLVEEDGASFGVIALKMTRVNKVEDLEQEAALWEEGD